MNVVPTRDELKTLAEQRAEPGISIYMPTHRGGQETRQNPIRFKNLYTKAQNLIGEETIEHDRELQKMLKKGRSLLDDYHFWQHQSDGLAFFQTREGMWTYRLPMSFEEIAIVNNRLHIKPLLPVLSANGLFYILAISQKKVQLFRATRFHVGEVQVPGIPQGIDEVLQEQEEAKSQQHHAVSHIGPSNAPTGAHFHSGHAATADSEKERLFRYFREVDKAVSQELHDKHAPLVLAAVDYLHPIYHEANRYPHLLEEGIKGSPDRSSPEELLNKTWDIVQPHFQKTHQEAANQFHDLSSGERASADLRTVLPASFQGRIDTLFVPLGEHVWGDFDPDSQNTEIHQEMGRNDQDLLDYAAMQTFAHGGRVFAVQPEEVPGENKLAAVFRY